MDPDPEPGGPKQTDPDPQHCLMVYLGIAHLTVFVHQGVENPKAALAELKEFLPTCEILYPPHTLSQEGDDRNQT